MKETKKLFELFNKTFNCKCEYVIDYSQKKRPFKIEKIINSLYECGLGFRQTLDILDSLSSFLKNGITTSELKNLICETLKKENIQVYEKYKEEYFHDLKIVAHPFVEEELILNVDSTKKIIEHVLEDYYFTPNAKNKMIKVLLDICKTRYKYSREIQFYQMENRVNNAIKSIYGRGLDEFITESGNMIDDAINVLFNKKYCEYDLNTLINISLQLCTPILIFFKIFPGLNSFKTIGLCKKFFNGLINPTKTIILNNELIKFFHNIKNYKLEKEIFKDINNVRNLIEIFTDTLRKLLAFFQEYDQSKDSKISEDKIEQIVTNLKQLSLFGKFIWPLTNRELFILNAREDVLRFLYRYSSMDVVQLLKKVQIHPKYMDLVIRYLKNQKYIITHEVFNKTIVLLTKTGEKYCEETLGFRIRYNLPYL